MASYQSLGPRPDRKELYKLIHQISSATNSGLEMSDTILEKNLVPFSIGFMARRGLKPTANSSSGLKPTESLVKKGFSSCIGRVGAVPVIRGFGQQQPIGK